MKAPIHSALSDKSRPPAHRSRDRRDRAEQMLAFSCVRGGEVVADFLPLRGYWTRLFATIVGPGGYVYAAIPRDLTHIDRIANAQAELATWAEERPNVCILSGPTARAGSPRKTLDLFWIWQNYHDLHDPFMGSVDIDAFNAAVFAALKPGGRYVVVDHAAATGSPAIVTDTKHRIEPLVARREIERAGFVFDRKSAVLAEPDDPRTQSIFARGRRYRTDRFAFRFRKPQ